MRLGTVQILDARGPGDFDRVFAAASSGRAGALLVLDLLKTAKSFGLTIPQAVLFRADTVIR
ncbi:MAG: hypothetical protein HYV62_10995 [Candidatus Rokubacteria bacterium]|nr:hypothetical protein [Candidatus Rokubacteria bacterium]